MNLLFSGLMIDAGRCLEQRHYYRQVIDFAAERGVTRLLWHFSDDQGCAVEFASVPDIASPHAYSRSEVRILIKYARSRGVEIIPELASLGHTAYLTRLPRYKHLAESNEMFSSICPVAPETRGLIAALLEETCDIFDTPIVHAGLDETNFGMHPLSAEALRTRTKTDIFADHVMFVHEALKKRGRQMWMWADGLLHDAGLADRLPRDIVQCNWRYRPQEPIETTQQLLDRGYDVVLCSAAISSQQTLFPGEQFALPNIRSLRAHEGLSPENSGGRVIGRISTVWTPVRYVSESLWLGLDLVIALMSGPIDVDLKPRIAEFGSDFYGLSNLGDWTRACEIVLQRSPERDEWLAAITMHSPDNRSTMQIRSAAPQWADAERMLQELRPEVRKHVEEFDAFLLMVNLASTAYTLSSRAGQMSADEAMQAVERWQTMIAAIDAQWDVERFADDPRKYAAPIHHYAGDHLIPMMKQGLQRLLSRAETKEPAGVL